MKWPLGWPVGAYPGPQVGILLISSLQFQYRASLYNLSHQLHLQRILVHDRALIIVVLELISRLAETYQMPTTRLVYMPESTLVAPMEKSCLARFSLILTYVFNYKHKAAILQFM